MNCPNCIKANPDEAKFCMHCGKRIQLRPHSVSPFTPILLFPLGAMIVFGITFTLLGFGRQETPQKAPRAPIPSPTAPHRIPSLDEIKSAVQPIGFRLKQSGESHYEAKVIASGKEYRLVILTFPGGVDTLRIQFSGRATEKIRWQLFAWANQVLAGLSMGSVPEQVKRAIFDGTNMVDEGIYNGFCGVAALQNNSSLDRISIDLVFNRE
jgi:hypothetical protein